MCGASFGDRLVEEDTPPTPEQQLCEYAVQLANRGAGVAEILERLLAVFSEEPRHRAEHFDDRRAAEVSM